MYPQEAWNFVFGLANLAQGCGTFSFCRHQALESEGGSPEERHQLWMKRSCSTMVHEIGHMFGLKHCIYYECILNGSNGSFELRHPDRVLCPVCLCKLKLNIKFDIRERTAHMVEACRALGFQEMA